MRTLSVLSQWSTVATWVHCVLLNWACLMRHWRRTTTSELSRWVDQASLRRLAEQGLAPFPPAAIGSLADWCWDMGETTGDARYCSLWRALSWIGDLFDDTCGVPTAAVERLDMTLREWIPAIL